MAKVVGKFVPLFGDRSVPCSKDLLDIDAHGIGNDDDDADPSNSFAAVFDDPKQEAQMYEAQLAALARQVTRLSTEKEEKQKSTDGGEADTASNRNQHEQDEILRDGEEDDIDCASDDSEDPDDNVSGATSSVLTETIVDDDAVQELNVERTAVVKGPKLFYKTNKNEWLSVFRDILPGRGNSNVEHEIKSLHQSNCWGFVLMRGGHFAGAVIRNGKFLRHKCYHRYVVRAKRGTVQSVQDNKSGTSAPQSAGASLRRHNETALYNDVQQLIKSWSSDLDKCAIIFVQAPQAVRPVLFGANKGSKKQTTGVLQKNDARIRSVPFPTGRPTMQEISAIYARLAAVYRQAGSPVQKSRAEQEQEKPQNQMHLTKAVKPQPMPDILAKAVEGVDPEYVDSLLYIAALKSGAEDLSRILSLLSNDDNHGTNYAWNSGGETALHAASKGGFGDSIKVLLEHGADPTIVNERHQVPFEVSKDKETRNAFRRFMAAEPDKWDYGKAKIPSPLTAEMEQKQAERAKAEKKKQRDRKKQQTKQKAVAAAKEAEQAVKEQAEADAKRDAFLAEQRRQAKITPRERAAAAALARFEKAKEAAQKPPPSDGVHCSHCGGKLGPPNTRFERFQFVYCCTGCLKEHTPIAMKAQ